MTYQPRHRGRSMPKDSLKTTSLDSPLDPKRRQAIKMAGVGALAVSGAGLLTSGAQAAQDVPPLKSEFLFSASVKRGKITDLGPAKLGGRRVATIDGGTFEGPRIRGDVLPGGGYFQTIRDNGAIMLHTEYLLKTDDGVTIYTRNQAVAMNRDNDLYVRANIFFEAPNASPYAWLNDYLFVGSGRPNMETNSTDLIVYQIL